MMTMQQHLLGKLAEEASELAQIAIKAQQFGLTHTFGGQGDHPKTNLQLLEGELNDVLGMVRYLNEGTDANIKESPEAQRAKMRKAAHWMARSREMGFVQ